MNTDPKIYKFGGEIQNFRYQNSNRNPDFVLGWNPPPHGESGTGDVKLFFTPKAKDPALNKARETTESFRSAGQDSETSEDHSKTNHEPIPHESQILTTGLSPVIVRCCPRQKMSQIFTKADRGTKMALTDSIFAVEEKV